MKGLHEQDLWEGRLEHITVGLLQGIISSTVGHA